MAASLLGLQSKLYWEKLSPLPRGEKKSDEKTMGKHFLTGKPKEPVERHLIRRQSEDQS